MSFEEPAKAFGFSGKAAFFEEIGRLRVPNNIPQRKVLSLVVGERIPRPEMKESGTKGRAYRAFSVIGEWLLLFLSCRCDHRTDLGCDRRRVKRNTVLDGPLYASGFDHFAIADLVDAGRIKDL